MKTRIAVVFFLVISSTSSMLYAQGESSCSSVLSLTGRNFSYNEERQLLHKQVYDQTCSQSSGSSSFRLGAVSEDLLSKAGLNVGWGSDKAKSFCEQNSYLKDFRHDALGIQSNVVIEAIGAWERCVALDRKGVAINVINKTSQLTIDVKRTGRDPVTFTGLTHNGDALDCATTDNNGERLEILKNTRIPVESHLGIVCLRSPNQMDNTSIYRATPVTLTFSEHDSYPFELPPVVYPAHSSLAEISTRISEVESITRGLVHLQALSTWPGDAEGSKWEAVRGKPKTIETIDKSCPSGQYVSGIGFIKDDGGTKCHTCISGVRFRCTPFPK